MLSRPKGNSFESRALCKSNAQNHTFACVLMAVVYSTVSHQSTFHTLAPQRTPSLLENVSLRTTKKEKRGFSEVACKCCKTRKTDDPWSDIEFPGPAWCKAVPAALIINPLHFVWQLGTELRGLALQAGNVTGEVTGSSLGLIRNLYSASRRSFSQ